MCLLRQQIFWASSRSGRSLIPAPFPCPKRKGGFVSSGVCAFLLALYLGRFATVDVTESAQKLPPHTADSNPLPRIRIVWGKPASVSTQWRMGLFALYVQLPGFPERGIAISVRGLLRWALVLGIAGYLGAAAVLSWWFRREPHNQIGYTDVLTWPLRGNNIARLRGEAWLAQGLDALKEKRWAQGLFLVRRGLDRCPGNFNARFILARFYLLSGQRPLALEILAVGPLHGRPPQAWLQTVLGILVAGEDWATLLRVVDASLPYFREPMDQTESNWLLGQKLGALTAVGRASEALALAEAHGDTASMPVKLARVQALRQLGRPEAAASCIERWRANAETSLPPDLLRLEAQALREAGQFAAMDRVLTAVHRLNPTLPEPLAFAVGQRVRAGVQGAEALEDYLFRFGSTPENLQLVAKLLVEIPDATLARRVATAAAERGYEGVPFRLQLALALLRQGEWAEFARVTATSIPAAGAKDPDALFWSEWMQSLAAVLVSAPFDPGKQLVTFMQTHALGLPAHLTTANALHAAGRDATAREVIATSRLLYAESPELARLQADVERVLALAMANPTAEAPPPNLAEGRGASTGTPLFRELDREIAAARWAKADQLAQDIRFILPNTSASAANDSELRWREIRIAQGLHDSRALRLHLTHYLDGSAARSAAVLNRAIDLHAAGEIADAITMARAVLEKTRDHAQATELLMQWLLPRKADPK